MVTHTYIHTYMQVSTIRICLYTMHINRPRMYSEGRSADPLLHILAFFVEQWVSMCMYVCMYEVMYVCVSASQRAAQLRAGRGAAATVSRGGQKHHTR